MANKLSVGLAKMFFDRFPLKILANQKKENSIKECLLSLDTTRIKNLQHDFLFSWTRKLGKFYTEEEELQILRTIYFLNCLAWLGLTWRGRNAFAKWFHVNFLVMTSCHRANGNFARHTYVCITFNDNKHTWN